MPGGVPRASFRRRCACSVKRWSSGAGCSKRRRCMALLHSVRGRAGAQLAFSSPINVTGSSGDDSVSASQHGKARTKILTFGQNQTGAGSAMWQSSGLENEPFRAYSAHGNAPRGPKPAPPVVSAFAVLTRKIVAQRKMAPVKGPSVLHLFVHLFHHVVMMVMLMLFFLSVRGRSR